MENNEITLTLTPSQVKELDIAIRNNAPITLYKDSKRVFYISDFSCIGRQLRRIREKKGITIAELSQKVGITPAFMSKVECNKMSLTKTRQLIAWVQGLGFDEIYFDLNPRK